MLDNKEICGSSIHRLTAERLAKIGEGVELLTR